MGVGTEEEMETADNLGVDLKEEPRFKSSTSFFG